MAPMYNSITESLNPTASLHTTREGKTMMIAQMTDNHLIATIKFWCSQIDQIKVSIKTTGGMGAFQARLYRIPIVSEEQAAEAVSMMLHKMMPYVLEAAIRGLTSKIEADLGEAIGRRAAIPADLPKLPVPGNIITGPDEDEIEPDSEF